MIVTKLFCVSLDYILYHYHFGLLSCHATCYKLHWVSLKFSLLWSCSLIVCDRFQLVNGVLGFVEIEVTRVIRLLAAKLSIKDDLHPTCNWSAVLNAEVE